MIGELAYYSRMAWGVRRLVPAPADPMAALQLQMARRQEHFLDLARRIVFSNPQHPYHTMFRIAGCAWEDLAH